jgi:hypothetical protein
MNSGQSSNALYSGYSQNLHTGVDFSKVSAHQYTGNTRKLSERNVSRSLIPTTQEIAFGDISRQIEYNNSNSINRNYVSNNISIGSGININSSTSGGSRGIYGSTSYRAGMNSSGTNIGRGISGIPSILATKGKSGNANQSAPTGLLASTSPTSGRNGTGLTSAQLDPFSDYIENDLTHPGGEPLGQPVPVGSGTLPFALFIGCYLFWLQRKTKKDIKIN